MGQQSASRFYAALLAISQPRLIRSLPVNLLLSAATGWLAWGSLTATLVLSPLIIWLWSRQPHRLRAWLCVLTYYLCAARGLPNGAMTFYADHSHAQLQAIALWLGACLIISLPWLLLWGRNGWYWRVPVLLILCIVPPFGAVGAANPVTAAGLIAPGTHWAGLLITLALLILICYRPLLSMLLMTGCALLGTLWPVPAAPDWIRAHNTRFADAHHHPLELFFATRTLQHALKHDTARVTLLPETIGGEWTSATQRLWEPFQQQLKQQQRTVILGVTLPIASQRKTHNALLWLGQQQGQLTQRFPVPVSMWQPWHARGTAADWFSHGTTTVLGHRVAGFICYEQLLPWPVLLSQWQQPDLYLAAANLYWARHTSLPAIQQTSLTAWARLFNVPVITAVNK